MKTLILVLTVFLIGFLIASVLTLNFLEYCHEEFEWRLSKVGGCDTYGGITPCYCFYPYDFVSRLIGRNWGDRAKAVYQFITYPVGRNYQ